MNKISSREESFLSNNVWVDGLVGSREVRLQESTDAFSAVQDASRVDAWSWVELFIQTKNKTKQDICALAANLEWTHMLQTSLMTPQRQDWK